MNYTCGCRLLCEWYLYYSYSRQTYEPCFEGTVHGSVTKEKGSVTKEKRNVSDESSELVQYPWRKL